MKLEIRNISFSYSGKEILSSVSFILNSGDVTALLGRNGSGKTTLMRLILGFIKPDSGAITLDGRDIREMSSKDRAKVIAYIPQKLSDAYPYSVFDSVMMGRAPSLSVFSSPKEKDREKAEEALARPYAGQLFGTGLLQFAQGRASHQCLWPPPGGDVPARFADSQLRPMGARARGRRAGGGSGSVLPPRDGDPEKRTAD